VTAQERDRIIARAEQVKSVDGKAVVVLQERDWRQIVQVLKP
jgi:hypothetical protein